jgi:hypothetical protein
MSDTDTDRDLPQLAEINLLHLAAKAFCQKAGALWINAGEYQYNNGAPPGKAENLPKILSGIG